MRIFDQGTKQIVRKLLKGEDNKTNFYESFLPFTDEIKSPDFRPFK